MDENTRVFLKTQRVSVISILQDDQTIHAATVHFAYDSERDAFYFLTHETSRKCRSLLKGKSIRAAVVIGFDEEACATYQADGKVHIARDAELAAGWEVYSTKYPDRAGARGHGGVVMLKFTPEWQRFSDIDVKERFKA